MNDTPRTNAVLKSTENKAAEMDMDDFDYYMFQTHSLTQHSRDLERELAEMKAQRDAALADVAELRKIADAVKAFGDLSTAKAMYAMFEAYEDWGRIQ